MATTVTHTRTHRLLLIYSARVRRREKKLIRQSKLLIKALITEQQELFYLFLTASLIQIESFYINEFIFF